MPPKRRRTDSSQSDTLLQQMAQDVSKLRKEITEEFIAQRKLIEGEQKKESYIEKFPAKEKCFSLCHSFLIKPSVMTNDVYVCKKSNDFGVDWFLIFSKSEDNTMELKMFCRTESEEDWSITVFIVGFDFTIGKKEHKPTFNIETIFNKRSSRKRLIKLNMNMYPDAKFSAKIKLRILKMTGIVKKTLNSFDEETEDTNLHVTVDGEKFFIMKSFIFAKSPVFKAMLAPSGNFLESGKNEITLTGIDPRDFQTYLEVLHVMHTLNGKSVLNNISIFEILDANVEGALHVANIYSSADAIITCEKYLLHETKLPVTTQFLLSDKYQLAQLMVKSLSKMDKAEIQSASEEEMSGDARKRLLDRLLEL